MFVVVVVVVVVVVTDVDDGEDMIMMLFLGFLLVAIVTSLTTTKAGVRGSPPRKSRCSTYRCRCRWNSRRLILFALQFVISCIRPFIIHHPSIQACIQK